MPDKGAVREYLALEIPDGISKDDLVAASTRTLKITTLSLY